MATKVIITRKLTKGKEPKLLSLLMELRAKAINQKGYISGETLKGLSDPDEFLVISTWRSLEDWQAWEKSSERKAVQAKIDSLLQENTVAKTYSYD